MKRLIQNLLCAAGMTVALAVPGLALGADSHHPGYVDLEHLTALSAAEATVDIRIGGWLMDMARQAAAEGDDEDLRVLSGIDSVRVRVFEMADKAADFRAEAENILDELRHTGWEEFARVRSDDELVFVMVKGDASQLQGITLVAIGDDDEAVFVNISGTIDPRDVARIINNDGLIHTNIDFDV